MICKWNGKIRTSANINIPHKKLSVSLPRYLEDILAAHTENRKISCVEQGEEYISYLQVPMEKPVVHCCLKIRDWLLNALLSFTMVLKSVEESGLPDERNLLC